MLKYIKGHLTSIDGIEIYPIISLIIFVTFFLGVAIYVFKADKTHFDKLKNLPLDEDKK